jgi:Domain of unknown function (DUF4397)
MKQFILKEKFMSRVLRVLPVGPVILLLCISAASCGSSSSTAQYRMVQTVPDAPGNFDISVNGKDVFTNVAFGSTEPAFGYQTVSTGSDPLEVFQTGGTTPLISGASMNLIAGTQSTVLLTGLYTAPTAIVLRDNNTAPVSGQAELRIVDASPSAPASLDIYVVAPGIDITQRPPTIPALQFGEQSAYQDLTTEKSGDAQIMVIVTKSGDPTKTQYVNQIYTLSASQIRTLVLVDASGGGAISLAPLELSDLN